MKRKGYIGANIKLDYRVSAILLLIMEAEGDWKCLIKKIGLKCC